MTTGVAHENHDDLVWYVAYGSNLLRGRFLTYLQGGFGPSGSGYHAGARDSALPHDDRAVLIDRRLIFTGRSRRWGGGVCAVVRSDGGEECLARAWLITAGQLLDVWQQENGRLTLDAVPWAELGRNGHVDDLSGRYRRLDRLDPIDGVPAVTITCGPEMIAEQTPPTSAYLDMVIAGLGEAWQLGPADAARYLRGNTDEPPEDLSSLIL